MCRHVDGLCGAMLIIKMPVLGTGAGSISVNLNRLHVRVLLRVLLRVLRTGNFAPKCKARRSRRYC